MDPNNVDDLVAMFVKIRDKRSDLKKEMDRFKGQMDILGARIEEIADVQGVTSFATPHGTAFKSTKTWVKVDNWDLALDFILAGDLKHLLTKSVKKASAVEYMAENNNTLPPGLSYGEKVEISVRRK